MSSRTSIFADLGRAIRRARYPDFWLFLVAGCIGWASGIVVTVMSRATQWLHMVLFHIPLDERLSSQGSLASPWLALVPLAGGVLVILLAFAFSRRITRIPVDPIEANALHGGQMSFLESLLVTLQTIISSGFGASVGLEAGYTQASAVIGSKLATAMDLRRVEVRMLVGCATAGAISAAFDAPLTGAFYAFETILGVYNVSLVAPVLAAAIAARFSAQLMGAEQMPLLIGSLAPMMSLWQIIPYLVLGAMAAVAAVGIMRLVILVERLFQMARCPTWARPLIGGVLVGLCGLISPHVLSSGHGALHVELDGSETYTALLLLFALKAVASALSLGSGFRGGLFFASLYLGLLFGKSVALALAHFGLLGNFPPELFGVVGMASMATGIVGGPLTMTFLIVESTLDLGTIGAVLAASVVASMVVRATFGYSFSTWRLHLRGESIKGAHDIGRIRGLTVGRMMRKDPAIISHAMSLEAFKAKFPLGAAQRVVVVDDAGAYAGLVIVTDAHAPRGAAEEISTISSLVKYKENALLPNMAADRAARIFESSNSEELAVLSDARARKPIGLLTEQHLLRRYTEELDKSQSDLAGTSLT